MTLDTAVLADLAAKATPGPWDPWHESSWDTDSVPGDNPWTLAPMIERNQRDFIIAFSPDVAAALLAEVESLRKALTGLLNQYTDDTGNFHDACDERECAVARAVAVARAALVSEEGSR